MRSIKRMLLFGFTAALMMALAIPAVATAANWTKEGKELAYSQQQWTSNGLPLTESKPITLQGTIGSEGEVECSMTLSGTVGPGFKGTITEASTSLSSCVLGAVPQFYGCKSVSSVTANELPWPAVAARSGGEKAVYLGVNLTYNLKGGIFCPKWLTATGLLVAKPDNANAIGSVTLSGTTNISISNGESYSSEALGTLNVSPGTYGILTTDVVALSGSLGSVGEESSLSCTVNGLLALDKGSEGKLISLKWSSCANPLNELACGAIKSVTTGSLPMSAIDEGTKIKFPEFSFTIKYEHSGCDEYVSGALFATPDKVGAISSTSLSGTLKSNGSTSKTWSGSVNWTPAGVYGL